jgi:hypothetical protein
MIRFFKNLFKGKDPGPLVEPTKVDVANAAPYKIEAPAPVVETKPAPKKKRTFVKREDSGVAKVAPVKVATKPKAPAKPRAPSKPKAK